MNQLLEPIALEANETTDPHIANLSPKLVGFAEDDVRSRPFKLLRTVIGRQLPDDHSQLVGITSPSPNAGKSFVASNLAASMSRLANRSTVLVDLDLQRATIAQLFGLTEGLGVAEYLLEEETSLMKVARPIGETRLTVLPTFLRPLNSAELIASTRFTDLLEGAKSLAEKPVVICDLPPLFVSDDAMLASEHLDGIIIVVEQGVTTKRQLEASLRLLGSGKIIGTIFNRSSGGFGDPYGYSGSYGSSYK